MTADRLTACQTGDGLVHHSLENRSRQVFLGSTFVDQRLDICLGKYTASGGDRINCLIILCVFVQSGCICLDEGCHLVDKRTCTTGTDTVHTLFHITALEINDLRILTAKLDSNIGLWCIVL